MGNLITKNKIVIKNNYESMEELSKALRVAGLEKCNLLVAIDFTKSNTWQGEKTFNNKCLHYIPENKDTNAGEGFYEAVDSMELNQYQQVLQIIQKPLNEFDEDKRIPTAIFGHTRNQNETYVKEIYDAPHSPDKTKGCHGLEGVLAAYELAVKDNTFSGGTLFTPVLKWAERKVLESKGEYHILVILGDGCIDDMKETQEYMKLLSNTTPLSIVFVGIGDGSDPDNKNNKWKKMCKLDDEPFGNCDIWQSVYLSNIQQQLNNSKHPDVELATMMLMEIPDQYLYFKNHGLIQ